MTATQRWRCQIIDVAGWEIAPGVIAATPAKSRPHIGKQGYASKDADGDIALVLDDGTKLTGMECWWRNLELREPLAF